MTQNIKQIKSLIINVLNVVDKSDSLNLVWADTTVQKNIKSIVSVMKEGAKKYKDPNAPKRSKSAFR